MDELIHKLSPKAWFELSVNPYESEKATINHIGTISAGDRYVESELSKSNLH